MNKGKIINQVYVYGVPEKGEALKNYTDSMRSAKQEAISSMEKTRVPREYEEMVRDYFSYNLQEAEEDNE